MANLINLKDHLRLKFTEKITPLVNIDKSEVHKAIFETYKYRVEQKTNLRDELKYKSITNDISEHLTNPIFDSLIMTGTTCNGKTMLLEIINEVVNYVNNKKYPVIDTTALFNHLKSNSSISSSNEDFNASERFKFDVHSLKVKFIDDLGAEEKKDFGREPVRHFLEVCINKGDRFICTSNLNNEDINSFYGKRVESRIQRGFLVIDFGDKSYE